MTLTLILVGVVLVVLAAVAYLVIREGDHITEDTLKQYQKPVWEPTAPGKPEPPKPPVDLVTKSLKRKIEVLRADTVRLESELADAKSALATSEGARMSLEATLAATENEYRASVSEGLELSRASHGWRQRCEAAEAKLAAHTCPVVDAAQAPAPVTESQILLRLVSNSGRFLGETTIPARSRRNTLRHRVKPTQELSNFVADRKDGDVWIYRRVGVEKE